MTQPEYSEEDELRKYVRRNYMYLMPVHERQIYNGAILKVKKIDSDPATTAVKLNAVSDYLDNPEVDAVTAEGIPEFYERFRATIYEEYRDKIFINRCEKCDRIVASPVACTCLWCGHAWYDRRNEMEAASHCCIYPERQA